MPLKDETDRDETEDTDTADQLASVVTEIVESIDENIRKIEDIDRDELRNRILKRLDKAKEKLEVAKCALEKLTE